ncbi:secreted in xylem 5 [Colletotrichum asianum]|uniref:Secreted in xylem 5 n=1 Tax=Colletotrichum asianum TaxID=702518 RepID=A0A8H3ZKD6_9PEZI|nr:secreted in xylem 5 [Colletotrichum asianum]
MRSQLFAALITLLPGVLADSHDYCACQQWSDGPVDHVATAKVAARACFGYLHMSTSPIRRQPGTPTAQDLDLRGDIYKI